MLFIGGLGSGTRFHADHARGKNFAWAILCQTEVAQCQTTQEPAIELPATFRPDSPFILYAPFALWPSGCEQADLVVNVGCVHQALQHGGRPGRVNVGIIAAMVAEIQRVAHACPIVVKY